jgi:hypothetical protein
MLEKSSPTLSEYKATLGTDEVIVCPQTEKVTYAEILPDLSIKEYVEPTIQFTKWNKEESLTLSYPDTQFSDKTLVDGELQLSAGKESFYFRQHADTLKFGLILNEIPKTNTWTLKLAGWENLIFDKQPPLTEEWKVGDICPGGIIATVTETQCIDKDGKILISRPEDIVNGYMVSHKTKVDHIEGQTNYGTGVTGFFHRIKLLDSDSKFIGYAILDIKDGNYIITVDQKILDTAKYPIRFNDTFGSTDDDTGWSVQTVTVNYPICYKCPSKTSSGGTLTKVTATTSYSQGTGLTIRARVYGDSAGEPAAMLTDGEGSKALAAWTETGDITMGSATIANDTQYWLAIRPDANDYSLRYAASAGATYRWMNGATWSDPWNAAGDSATDDIKMAIYATYTAGGGGGGIGCDLEEKFIMFD